MGIFDDAAFDLTPNDVSTFTDSNGDTYTDLSTDGVTFSRAPQSTYVALNNAVYAQYLGWTGLAGSDVDTEFLPNAYEPAGYTTPWSPFIFTVAMGQAHANDTSDPIDTFLAGINLGTYPVELGVYFVDCQPILKSGLSNQVRCALVVIWSNNGSEVSRETLTDTSSDFPASYTSPLYQLNVPASANEVTLEMWAVPQTSSPIPVGAGFGVNKFVFFKQTSTGIYDEISMTGYYGNGLGPVVSGRNVGTRLGKTVILGLTAAEEAPVPNAANALEITVVGAWMADASLPGTGGWLGGYVHGVGVEGLGNQVNLGGPAGWQPAEVAVIGHVVAVAMTYTEASKIARFYDLTGAEVGQVDWNPYEQRLDTAWYNTDQGLVRLSAWHRILSPEEILTALNAAAGIAPHDLIWDIPSGGGAELTGYVVAEWDGETLVEHKLTDPMNPAFTTTPGVTAVQVFAVNAIGRSAPTEISF